MLNLHDFAKDKEIKRLAGMMLDLTYSSKKADTLRLTGKGTRELDGKPADLNYDTYDSPCLQSKWKSGLIEVRKGTRKLTLDFRK